MHYILLILLVVVLSSCGGEFDKYNINDPSNYRGNFKVGSSYKIGANWYHPEYKEEHVEKGVASWYGKAFHGKKTANGDVFNRHALTAAHRTLPLPSIVRVTNLNNGKSAMLMINDRGPFAYNRVLDVSEKGAETLGFKEQGTAKVKIEYMKDETELLLGKLNLKAQREKVLARHTSKSRNVPKMAKAEPNNTAKVAKLASNEVRKPKVVKSLNSENYVQIATFTQEKNALKMKKDYSHLGKVEVSTLHAKKKNLHQVRIGPFKTKAEASKMMKKLASLGHKDAIIVNLNKAG